MLRSDIGKLQQKMNWANISRRRRLNGIRKRGRQEIMREWMIYLRHKRGLTLGMAASRANCSQTLLTMLEYDDHITHPVCAARIAAVYGMDVSQYNQIVSKERREGKLPPPPPLPRSR